MDSQPKRVLGIEGGGTKTEWLYLGVEGGRTTTLGEGNLPAANLKAISDEALVRLFSVLPRDATHVGTYLAGCGTEPDRVRLREIASRVWPEAVLAVGSDRSSGMATAFQERNGIVVISGTGSAVHGQHDGRLERAGGWGQLLGDRGSGYSIAMQGLRLVLTTYDLEQRITPLCERILRALSLGGLTELVDWAKNADKMSVAKLVPVIFEAAAGGDAGMFSVIDEGAGFLADYTRAVARRLEVDTPEIKLMGGLFTHYPLYVQLFEKHLALPRAMVSICAESGAIGSAWLAAGVRGGSTGIAEAAADREELSGALTESRNSRSERLDELSTVEMVDLFVSEERFVEQALGRCREGLARAVDLVAECLLGWGRLFYAGAGTSGRLGVLDASEIPPTFGASPELVQGIIAGGFDALHRAVEGAEDQADRGRWNVVERGVRKGDVVCGIASSGRTPFVLGALQSARAAGARTILLTCNPARRASVEPWDVEIDLPTGPELITGSTRLKAGTATKVALNLLSSCAMVRLGKVRGNLMIDLNASNAKLRDRAIRLVTEIKGWTYEEAQQRLEAGGWNVRDCLARAQVDPGR